jgi:hypothetical protein
MKSKLIILSGIWNLGLAAVFLYPPLYRLGLNLIQPLWGWLLSGFLLFTSAVLIIGGRDVKKYGSILVHEAFLRFIAAALLIPAALFFNYGWLALFGGVTDTLWGIALVLTVPRLSGRTFVDLVLDRQTTWLR